MTIEAAVLAGAGAALRALLVIGLAAAIYVLVVRAALGRRRAEGEE